MPIEITPNLSIAENEIQFESAQSGGPGGQNVNKVSTAIFLRFDIENSPSLPEEVKARLKAIAGKKVNKDGILLIKAMQHRSQLQNREEAVARLAELVHAATVIPRKRRPTKRTRASRERRLEHKRRQSMKKADRSQRWGEE
ncbi:MAG: alternative ribosome rescue aminoacyl-tRNA hydrolase ArfB [Anaerolineae bacterium]|jgi:ribosome-associated protein|nr:alternative ribosome rescue aminoacyl-tRNA hydrolase ArfB [Anaerolineae bacterium]